MQTTSIFGENGLNTKTASEFVGLKNTLECINYLIGQGEMRKRQGYEVMATMTDDITFVGEYDVNRLILGYGTTIAVIDKATWTVEELKTDFAGGNFDGDGGMGIYYVSNGVDVAHAFERTIGITASKKLLYVSHSGTGTLTVGATITQGATTGTVEAIHETSGTTMMVMLTAGSSFTTGSITGGSLVFASITAFDFARGVLVEGGTSGASARLLASSGSLWVMQEVDGTLTNGETITTTTPVGVLSGTISTAPDWRSRKLKTSVIAKNIKIIDDRLYMYNLVDDPSGVIYSSPYAGSYPWYNTWTVGSTVGSAGLVSAPNLGTIYDIVPFGNGYVCLHEYGRIARYIETLDSGGTLSKVDRVQDIAESLGGNVGILTRKGMYYAGKNGLHVVQQIATLNQPYSGSEAKISNILADSFFANIDFSSASIVYDTDTDHIFIACAKDSQSNNLVLAYNLQQKALTTINGWTPVSMINSQGIYAGMGANLCKLFSGDTDGGSDIETRITQEVPLGDLIASHILERLCTKGFLSESSVINVAIGAYSINGEFTPAKKTLQFTSSGSSETATGYGSAGWGSSGYASSDYYQNTIETFKCATPILRNIQRLRITTYSLDSYPHILNYMYIQTKKLAPLPNRKLIQI
jgi:hypothetical protein